MTTAAPTALCGSLFDTASWSRPDDDDVKPAVIRHASAMAIPFFANVVEQGIGAGILHVCGGPPCREFCNTLLACDLTPMS